MVLVVGAVATMDLLRDPTCVPRDWWLSPVGKVEEEDMIFDLDKCIGTIGWLHVIYYYWVYL